MENFGRCVGREELCEALNVHITVLKHFKFAPSLRHICGSNLITILEVAARSHKCSIFVSRLFGALLISFPLGVGLYDFFASGEVSDDLLFRGVVTLHPCMLQDLFSRQTFLGVEFQHVLKGILKLIREDIIPIVCCRVGGPEIVVMPLGQQTVVRVVWLGLAERGSLCENREQDDR